MQRHPFLGAVLAISFCSDAPAQDVTRGTPDRDKIALAVLFAGEPETVRTKDFLSLLKEHFKKVQFVAIGDYEDNASSKHDVVILDSTNYRTKVAGLSRDSGQPTILIGTLGGMLGMRLKLRTNWC